MGFIIGIITLLPSILQLILQINELFKGLPGSGQQGPVKKQLIMDTLSIAGANSKTADTVSKVVDKSVTTLKTVGWDSDTAVPTETTLFIQK